MPLRKRSKPSVEPLADGSKAQGKRSKRQRIVDFFRARRQKAEQKVTIIPLSISHPISKKSPSHKLSRDSEIADSPRQANSNSPVDITAVNGPTENKEFNEHDEPTHFPTPPPESQHISELEKIDMATKDRVDLLSEKQLGILFSGAPHFAINTTDSGPHPSVSHPWDEDLVVQDVSDSAQLSQPAFSAATLRRHLPLLQQPSDQEKQHLGYDINLVEVPSMLSAQGLERGSVGFVHFLELPNSDSLITDLQQSQSTNGFLEAVRNKDQMQTNPERLGIRKVNMTHVYDRLAEFGDLIEVFHDTPGHMTILNNQSSGDLYANLFGKFLTPPPYDDATDDPTGMKVQINALLRTLGLKGVWHDFSLVEWRIRLGQILWSDRDVTDDDDTVNHLWTEREILLLQLTLACELLFRLDAITSMDVDEVISQIHVSPADYEEFKESKTRKLDWDLVLARRFLDNILVIREDESGVSVPTPKSRGLLSMFNPDSTVSPKPDIVFLPRHQVRQLSGLLHFAEVIQWPRIDLIVEELALKLGTSKDVQEPEQLPSPQGKFLDPSTPSSISVYGTPLATPRTPRSVQDSYFGHLTRPALDRTETPRSLTVPLSSPLLAHATENTASTLNVGGWLSRSLLTGIVLPGEAISHFLMSTLIENDRLAIAALGDAANLYGGLIYSEKSWWSKSSVAGRVLACLDGATECMGWIYIPKLPEDLPDAWYSISSEQLQFGMPPRIMAEEDLVARDSAIVPGGDFTKVKPEDLTLPQDPTTPPVPSIVFTQWDLKPTSELLDNDTSSSSPSEIELHKALLTFASPSRGTTHTLTLTYDVQFITSFPCTPPSVSPSNASSLPVLKRSPSRTSSKRSVHNSHISRIPISRRNSHGFEPLLSHPPDSASMAPIPTHSSDTAVEAEEPSLSSPPKSLPLKSHPLHISCKYQVLPATDVLDPAFKPPFPAAPHSISPPPTPGEEGKDVQSETPSILVLDARSSRTLELLSRAWCAQIGVHAIISRVGRTCLSCSVREARGLGVWVVVRVEG